MIKRSSLGVILLCHDEFERVAEVVRFWRAADVPVALHVDARRIKTAPLTSFKSDKGVIFIPRRTCRWGSWDIVGASLDGVDLLLPLVKEDGHILLQSGSCVPLHPVAQLQRHLDENKDVDFIESVPLQQSHWVQGGLSRERFSLYHITTWQEQRGLFDFSVKMQRALGINRRFPAGLRPYLGAQWWCLTHKTLAQMRTHPKRGAYERFFQSVWIPDESYFQTMVRLFARYLKPPLSWSKFDRYGKPFVLYDEHAEALMHGAPYLVRKVDPKAQRIYDLMGRVEVHAPQVAHIDQIDRRSRLSPSQRGLSRAPWAQRLSQTPYLVILHGQLPPDLAATAVRPFDRSHSSRQWLGYAAVHHLRDLLHPTDRHIVHLPLEDLQVVRDVILEDGYATVLLPTEPPVIPDQPRLTQLLAERLETWHGLMGDPRTRARHAVLGAEDLAAYLRDWTALHAWES